MMASAAEWIHHRKTITRLYSQLTLDKVMLHMGQCYNFFASVKSYKVHIKQWGLDKNFKRKEALAMLVLANHYKTKGVLPTFTIRGKQIRHANLQRYARRAHITSAEVYAIQPDDVGQLAPDLRCLVPETFTLCISAPENLHRSELLVHSLSSYLDAALDTQLCQKGPFDQLTWGTTNSSWDEVRDVFQEGLERYQWNRLNEAAILWRYGFLRSEQLVNDPDPVDWLSWIKTQGELVDAGVAPLASALRTHIISLTTIRMKAPCPQLKFVKALCSLNQQEAEAALPLLCHIVHQTYKSQLPSIFLAHQLYRLSLILQVEYGRELHRMLINTDTLRITEKSTGDEDDREFNNLLFKLDLVNGARRYTKVSTAIKIVRDCLSSLGKISHPTQRLMCESRSRFLLGSIYLEGQRYELAKTELIHCLKIDQRFMECCGKRLLFATSLESIYRLLDSISNETDIADGDQQWRLKMQALQEDIQTKLAEAVEPLKLDEPLLIG